MINAVSIIANNKKPNAVKASLSLKSELTKQGIQVWMEEDGKIAKFHDLMIILGGDGTVLRAFNQYCHLGVPILCINFGTVGFLSTIGADNYSDYIPLLIEGKYQVVERPIMKVCVHRNNESKDSYYSLNDLVIRSDHMHISRQLLRIDGREICQYEGDGLIIATPTGSTGYSLSAGGPIVETVLDLFIITPLVSRKIALSSLIIGMNHTIEINCQECNSCSKYYIDGQELARLNNGDSVKVRSTDLKAKFVLLHPNRYFELLHKRFI